VAPLDPRLPVVGAGNRQEIGKLLESFERQSGFLKINPFIIYKFQIQLAPRIDIA
jgi:hypothetical protein